MRPATMLCPQTFKLSRLVGISVFILVLANVLGMATAESNNSSKVIEVIGKGSVNWSTGWVKAKGVGIASPKHSPTLAQVMAERAARAVALRNLLETIKGIRVDSETIVENLFVKEDVIVAQVEGMLAGAQQIALQTQSDGTVEIELGLPMKGDLSNAIVPQHFGKFTPVLADDFLKSTEPPSPDPAVPEPGASDPDPLVETPPPKSQEFINKEPMPSIQLPQAVTPSPQSSTLAPEQFSTLDPLLSGEEAPVAPQRDYTGLIVDARHIGLRPALVPRLLTEQGREFYVSDLLSRDQAVQSGVVGYSKDLVSASRQERVTNQPLIVKGLQAVGPLKTDIVLSQSDIEHIQRADTRNHFLREARVVIIYD